MPGKIHVWTSPKHHTLRGYTREEYKTRKCHQFPLRVPKIDLKVSTSSKKKAVPKWLLCTKMAPSLSKVCTKMAPFKNLIFEPRSHFGTIFGEKLKSVPNWDFLGFEICISGNNCVSCRISHEFNTAAAAQNANSQPSKFTKSVPEWLLCTRMAPS